MTPASAGVTAETTPGGLPAVSLPKGGGALRGMGEKFGANAVTGTGSMTVPIAASPGREGFGPDLSLSYDSAAGNGPFGFGWSLPLPAVTRKTDKGLPRYRDAEESDVFLISGAEDLVPVLEANGDRFEDRDTVPGYTIHRYRPRIEGTFARIERWTADDGDVHWRVLSRDNVLSVYGKDQDSRIADPRQAERVFSWLLCETRDHKGNAVVYTYKPEDGAGADLSSSHQRNRGDRDDVARAANRYVKRIRYGNRVPLLDGEGRRPRALTADEIEDADWMFEVVFDYGEHDPDVPRPDDAGTWDHRADAFSSHRSAFEVRTARVCRRALAFHHFPNEEGVGADCLVRSTDFEYGPVPNPVTVSEPVYAFLRAVTHTGYVRDGAGYVARSMPPLELQYTRPRVDEVVHEVDADSVAGLASGVDGTRYEWIDLRGDGVAGILTEQGGGWFYKRNVSPRRDRTVEFEPWSLVPVKPNATLGGGARFIDLAGDGRLDLVVLDGPVPGLYEQGDGDEWQPFRPFASRLVRDVDDPNLRFVDLNGDGFADVLITEDDAFVWHESLAEDGFGPASIVAHEVDEERGPALVLADGTQSIYLADMSGDGLSDLVRIRNGEVCYWPNLGHARFGAKVTMDNGPYFDRPDQFSQDRIRLADIDGTGTTDIVYLHAESVRLYFNQSGNCWSAARELPRFPRIDDVVDVSVTDLLGNGTSCLVWSSPLSGDRGRQLRYVDLMSGEKPHLLVAAVNNLGAETRVRYASSTKFRLLDDRDGRPWITRLPFPVHVVDRVEVYDRVSRNRFVTRYAYHHGYFDGEEREFRGFAMVEQWDTEAMAALVDSDVFPTGDNIATESHVPPVLIRSWFHTGVYVGRQHVSDLFAGVVDEHDRGEYWREPGLTDAQARALLLDDTALPAGLTADEEREACRALKGMLLRREVYARDGTAKADYPYAVLEQNFTLRRLQARGNGRHGVFIAQPCESLTYHYERNPADPRLQHTIALEIDDYGNVLKQAEVSYARRHPDAALPLPSDREVQARTLVTYAEQRFTAPVGGPGDVDDHRAPLPCETCTYELTGYTSSGSAGRLVAGDLVEPDHARPGRLRHRFDETLDYEEEPSAGRQRRVIGCSRTLYRSDDLTQLLPLGSVEPRALSGDTYTLALTAGLLGDVYVRDGQPLLSANAAAVLGGGPDGGGFVAGDDLAADGRFPAGEPAGRWWKPNGRVFLSPGAGDTAAQELASAQAHFFVARRYRDPFHGAESTENTITYDAYDLLPIETRDAAGNRATVGERLANGSIDPTVSGNDYRVLKPRVVTDPNGNRMKAAFDALGMVVGTATMGKRGDGDGDSLDGFVAQLDDPTTLGHLDDPLADPVGLLGRATTRLVYDLFAYRRSHADPDPQPVVVHTISRETHDSDLAPGTETKARLSFSYSDGFAREIQTKALAEPAQPGGPARWSTSGWTVFNNKGKPVRRYLPSFSPTHRFEFGVTTGVSAVAFYDPVERIVATVHPNDTFEKTVFDAWSHATWDANDTVELDPRTDPDTVGYVRAYFAALPQPDTWKTWHEHRQNPAAPADERAAAVKSEAHAETPTTAYLDGLGRVFLTLADNGPDPAQPNTHVMLAARIEHDVQGNERVVRDPVRQAGDARGRIVMRSQYDLLGNRVRHDSMDAGTRRTLFDAAGNAIRAWDDRGHAFRHEFDPLRRPLRSHVTGADPADPGHEVLTERVIYGEQHPDADQLNLRGRLYLHLDHAGVLGNEEHDFKGNVYRGSRRLAADYQHVLDWAAVDAVLPPGATDVLDLAALEAAVAPMLEGERFANESTFDALNREVTVTTPHTPAMSRTTLRYAYNDAGMLERVDANLRGASAAGAPVWTPFVVNIDYDALGRRAAIEYGNGATTTYDYDPLSLRLSELVTSRKGVPGDFPEPPPAGWPGCHLQNLHFTYDPVGNPTGIRDDAQQAVFFRNRRVEPNTTYTYDPTYRLIEATGREHLGQLGGAPVPHSHDDALRVGIAWAANDGNAMGTYVERYHYDEAGNLAEMHHSGTNPAHPGWMRSYVYGEASAVEPAKKGNRLTRTTVGNQAAVTVRYVHDTHGNMVRLPHLGGAHPAPNVVWDHRDQVRQVDLGGGGTAFYAYDAAGRRVRKVWQKTATLCEERIYFGGFEIFRRRQGAERLERETLHVVDDRARVAMVEMRTVDTAGNDPAPAQLVRYQIGNHLSTVALELDGAAQIVSYEEYSPYGSTVYQAVRSATETPKRYRYTGKERDEETGLLYHGARYYAPWIGRWTACDRLPALNRYSYARGSPVRLFDPDGKDESEGMTRVWGGLRALGGAAQLVLGGAALLTPEPTMVTKVVGTVAVINGTDDFLTGWRQMITGRQERGAIETTVTLTAEAAGMEEENARALGTGTSMALGFVSPTGPISGGGRTAVAVTAGATRTERVVVAASETPRIVQEVRNAQVASAITRAGGPMLMSSMGNGESSSSSGDASSSSSSSSSSAGEPNSSQIPDEYFDEAMSRLDQGDFSSGAHLTDLTSHAQSSAARAERGITGQSAHVSARSAMRDVAGYDPRAALTRILDIPAHRGFDDYWKGVFRGMAGSGQKTITVGEYFNVMRDAIGANPHFTTQEAYSMVELLRDELYVQHGLTGGDLLRLPYSR